ncbi:hypothetical protein M0812_22662 [Anaeramoeba flamelloides]|uniref:Rap-GAP domain-containing protein n=1 Tax=Anaeramoeba flamelloides TaxID=1746091 RepID=A0AAV7Z0J2_9EUKA|nr:hypothetical protein M0812_22662 [Anaeramoeba flamelloides]
MFLHHISQVTPSQHRKHTGVLINFPAAVKKTIISSVLEVYLKSEDLDRIFSSSFHIKWLFEFMGQAFALPIESFSIIEKAVQIYDLWLSEKRLPKIFYQKKYYFLREIMNHLSLIFEPRPGLSRDLNKKHVELCKSVLRIYEKLGKRNKKFLNNRTRKHLLFVMMGITDSLLKGEGCVAQPILTSSLSVFLLKILYELWIRLGVNDLVSWELFHNLTTGWVHRKENIIQWSATIFGLTNRVIGILYGKSEGTDTLTINLPPLDITFQPTVMNVNSKQIIFLWDKFLHILGNPNRFNSPVLFCQTMVGIKDVLNLFLNVGNRRDYVQSTDEKVLPDRPDGNTIMKIFGKWLFEAVSKNRVDFEEGVAIAFSILCSVFSTHYKKPFMDNYLSQFYSSIILAFENCENYANSICTILLDTESIFLRNLNGLYILVPHYLKMINLILTKDKLPFQPTTTLVTLRKSAILILKTLICLPNYFSNLAIEQIEGYSQDCVKNFNFISVLRSCILNGFSLETDPENAILFLWVMGFIIYETIIQQTTIPPLFLLTIQKFICQPTEIQKKWPIKVYLAAISVLRSSSCLIERINDCSTQTIPNIIIGMSRILVQTIKEPYENVTQHEFNLLLSGMINTIADFIIPSQWIFNYPNVISEVLVAIGTIFDSKPKKKKKSKEKKDEENTLIISEQFIFEARCIFLELLRISGNFPLPNGPSNISSSMNENDLIKESGLSKKEFLQYCRFFVHNNDQLFTVIDSPFTNDEEKANNTYVIVRDLTGKSSWIFKFRLLPLSFQRTKEEYLIENKREGKLKSPKYYETKPLSKEKKKELEIEFDLPIENDKLIPHYVETNQKVIKTAVTIQHRLEEVTKFIEEEFTDNDLTVKPPKPIKKSDKEYKFNESRMLLANLNLIHNSAKNNIKLINSNESFFEDLKKLDQTPERNRLSIGIIYIEKGQNRMNNGDGIFDNLNNKVDLEYKNFLKEIGWIVDLKNHDGWDGGLNYKKTGRYTPYYANYSTEIVFHTSTMLDLIKPEKRKNIIAKNKIIIVWCNDQRNFNPKCIKSKENLVFIIIRPHFTGLNTVSIEDYSGIIHYSGLLMNHCLVGRKILANLVRLTAINYLLEYLSQKQVFPHPYLRRNLLINDMIEKHSVKVNPDQLLSQFFSGINPKDLSEKKNSPSKKSENYLNLKNIPNIEKKKIL